MAAGLCGVAGVGLLAARPALAQGARPSLWQAEATASAVRVYANQSGFLLSDILNANLPYGSSAAGSDNQDTGLAAAFWPGAVAGAPSLLCTAGAPCSPGVPPPYPLSAFAQYPTDQKASVSTTQKEGGAGAPFSLTADDVRAEAGPGQTSTTAVVADVSVPGTAATESSSVAFRRRAASILAAPLGAQTVPADASTLLHVQSLIATTSITFSGSKLVSTATSLLHQVQLVGGVIDIGTLKATATSVTDGAKVTTSTSGLQVSDVTVGGEPATIGPSGVQVGHNTGLTPAQIAQLNQALSQALGTAGWQVALLTASSSRTPDAPQASSQGIMLFSQVDASSLPEGATYYTSLVLGNASSQATADASGNPDLSLLGGVSTGGIPGSTLSGPIAGSGGALAPSLPGAAPSPASVSSTAGAPVALASPGSAGHGLAQDLGQPASGSPLLRSSAAASDGSAARLTTLAYLIAVVLGAVLALGSPVLLALLTGRRLPAPLAAVIRYRLGRA